MNRDKVTDVVSADTQSSSSSKDSIIVLKITEPNEQEKSLRLKQMETKSTTQFSALMHEENRILSQKVQFAGKILCGVGVVLILVSFIIPTGCSSMQSAVPPKVAADLVSSKNPPVEHNPNSCSISGMTCSVRRKLVSNTKESSNEDSQSEDKQSGSGEVVSDEEVSDSEDDETESSEKRKSKSPRVTDSSDDGRKDPDRPGCSPDCCTFGAGWICGGILGLFAAVFKCCKCGEDRARCVSGHCGDVLCILLVAGLVVPLVLFAVELASAESKNRQLWLMINELKEENSNLIHRPTAQDSFAERAQEMRDRMNPNVIYRDYRYR